MGEYLDNHETMAPVMEKLLHMDKRRADAQAVRQALAGQAPEPAVLSVDNGKHKASPTRARFRRPH